MSPSRRSSITWTPTRRRVWSSITTRSLPWSPRCRIPGEVCGSATRPAALGADARAPALGVSIEASYTVGEYDILILSAKESDGLETWLKENGYRIPPGASRVLGSYLKQNMRFFVAR